MCESSNDRNCFSMGKKQTHTHTLSLFFPLKRLYNHPLRHIQNRALPPQASPPLEPSIITAIVIFIAITSILIEEISDAAGVLEASGRTGIIVGGAFALFYQGAHAAVAALLFDVAGVVAASGAGGCCGDGCGGLKRVGVRGIYLGGGEGDLRCLGWWMVWWMVWLRGW